MSIAQRLRDATLPPRQTLLITVAIALLALLFDWVSGANRQALLFFIAPVLLPATDLPASDLEGREGGATEWFGGGTALVIDDEETVRGLVRQMLERMGFDLLTAADGREGVELFRNNTAQIRMVVLDMTMPHLRQRARDSVERL